MVAPVNTVTTLANPGQREDLEDDIYLIAAEETPFTRNIGKTKVTARGHEWQIRDLRSPDGDNARLEGSDTGTLAAPNLTDRVGNYCQIYWESGGVSATTEAVDLAGRDSEFEEQKLIKGKEMARDIEASIIGNRASQNETSAPQPRHTAGALAWLESNTNRGAGGADGGWDTGFLVEAATNGDTRAFSEAQVKDVLATAFSNGARMTQGYMGPTHKQQFSAFAGIADIRVNAPARSGQATIVAAADVYRSDFGDITLIPHAYALTRDSLFIDPEYWAVGTLRPVQSKDLAVTGDNMRFELTAEKCLVARNEKGGSVVADLA